MIPNHVAIILDGNGRWAKAKGMPRNYGHTMGAKNVEVISKAAYDMGIRYLTLYAFSTENWNRPKRRLIISQCLPTGLDEGCHNLLLRQFPGKDPDEDKADGGDDEKSEQHQDDSF